MLVEHFTLILLLHNMYIQLYSPLHRYIGQGAQQRELPYKLTMPQINISQAVGEEPITLMQQLISLVDKQHSLIYRVGLRVALYHKVGHKLSQTKKIKLVAQTLYTDTNSKFKTNHSEYVNFCGAVRDRILKLFS